MQRSFWLAVPCATLLSVGCGGQVVFVEDDDGSGGTGGTVVATTTTSTTGATTTSTSTSGPTGGANLVEEPQGAGSSFAVEVTPTTLGLTLVSKAGSVFGDVSVDRLTAPSGSVVVDGLLPSNGYEWFWYGSVAMATPQVQHPETFPLAQGTWQFDVSSSAVSSSIWRRSTVDGVFHGGVLDVNVFIAGQWIGENEALEALQSAYNNWGGIELGDVRFFALGEQYLSVDENNVFDLLAETSVVPTRPALNVMAVAQISGAFEGAAGFSLGVPGVGVEPGSTSSAIVWMYTSPFFNPIILRHEAGHFSGLFHTSEFAAGQGDALDDTPFCPDVLAIADNCPDYDHIMFPTGGSGVGLFSPEQQKVLQAGALYRGVFAPGEAPMPAYQVVSGSGQAQAPANHSRSGAAPHGASSARHPTQMPTAAEAHLFGIGCPLTAKGELSNYFDVLDKLGGNDFAGLVAVLGDPRQPDYVRRRAAFASAKHPGAGRQLETLLADLAVDDAESELLRAGALGALGLRDAGRARNLAQAVATPSLPLLQQVRAQLQ